MNKGSLLLSAACKALAGTALMGLLLFLPAGTLAYPHAWLLIALLFFPMVLLGIVLAAKAPQLLEKRMNMREREKTQIGVVALAGVQLVLTFVLAGLDFRFGWTHLPSWIVWVASLLFLAGYALYGEVLRENAWLSRTVEIQDGQQLVDTGLYGVVRHPMYSATVLLFLSMPLVLASLPAFAVMLPYPVLLAVRIANEEQVLLAGLPGYEAYRQRVRWRMIPFLW